MHIEVWYDTTSDDQAPAWIVSEEDLDGGGVTLSVHPTKQAAVEAAKVVAAKKKLDLVVEGE